MPTASCSQLPTAPALRAISVSLADQVLPPPLCCISQGFGQPSHHVTTTLSSAKDCQPTEVFARPLIKPPSQCCTVDIAQQSPQAGSGAGRPQALFMSGLSLSLTLCCMAQGLRQPNHLVTPAYLPFRHRRAWLEVPVMATRKTPLMSAKVQECADCTRQQASRHCCCCCCLCCFTRPPQTPQWL